MTDRLPVGIVRGQFGGIMTFKELERMVDGRTLPLGAENEDGEPVIIEAGRTDGEKWFKLTTSQSNGWLRTNYIWENGTCEELFEKDRV